MKISRNWWAFVALFFMVGIANPYTLQAQSGEAIMMDDDDEDEDDMDEEEFELISYDDALITVNGKETALSADMEIERNQTLDIKISRLRPGSWVAVHIQKAGVKLQKHRWTSNEKGEIELEVGSGKKKVKGTAEIWYVPSNGIKKNLKVQMKII